MSESPLTRVRFQWHSLLDKSPEFPLPLGKSHTSRSRRMERAVTSRVGERRKVHICYCMIRDGPVDRSGGHGMVRNPKILSGLLSSFIKLHNLSNSALFISARVHE